MEIIIGIIVVVAIGFLVFGRKKEEEAVVATPAETVPTVTEVVEPTPAPVVEEVAAPAKKARKPKAAPAEKAAKPKKAPAAKAPAKKPAAKAKSKKA